MPKKLFYGVRFYYSKILCKCIAYVMIFSLADCTLSPKPIIPGTNRNDNYQSAIQYSHNYLEQFVKKTGTVGLAVAIVDSDRVVYSEGFGYADREAEKIVTDSTTFMIGSVTKLFTATAIMQLVEQGKVVLDSPITAYIPEFSIKKRFTSRQITVRDLLIHESGLPSDICNGFEIGQLSCTDADTMYRTVPALLANEYAANPPRTVFSYSNVAFSLLGIIIERASGYQYSRYIQDSIFTMLKMNHSALEFNDIRVKQNFAKGYSDKREQIPFYIRDLPAGMIVTNTIDLSRFLKMLLANGTLDDKHILDSNTLRQMWEPQNSDIPLDFDTLGLTYWFYNPTIIPSKIVQHGGNINTYSTFFAAFPEAKLGVVVFFNSLPGHEYSVSRMLLETFYEAKTGRKLPETSNNKNMPIVNLSSKKINEIAGFYQSNDGLAKVQANGTHLRFSFFGKTVDLIPHSDSTFSLQYKLFGFIPIHNRDLQNITVTIHTVAGNKLAVLRSRDFDCTLIGEKIKPETPLEEWIKRVGKYEISNEKKIVFANKEIEKENKVNPYILSYNPTDTFLDFNGAQLKTISPTEAITIGLGRDAGETVRAYTEDGKEYLWFSGYALKKIVEEKK